MAFNSLFMRFEARLIQAMLDEVIDFQFSLHEILPSLPTPEAPPPISFQFSLHEILTGADKVFVEGKEITFNSLFMRFPDELARPRVAPHHVLSILSSWDSRHFMMPTCKMKAFNSLFMRFECRRSSRPHNQVQELSILSSWDSIKKERGGYSKFPKLSILSSWDSQAKSGRVVDMRVRSFNSLFMRFVNSPTVQTLRS